MRYLLILGDGMADQPDERLGFKTPLDVAHTPNIDRVASAGEIGLVHTLLADYPLGSDVANMSILGYDPRQYYSGRAPLEAAAKGIKLAQTDLAIRANLVSFEGERLHDYTAGRISEGDAAAIVGTLKDHLDSEQFTFHVGKSYRHLLVWHEGPDEIALTPPHDIMGQAFDAFLPSGEAADPLIALMKDAMRLLENHPVNEARRRRGEPAVAVFWPWGEGRKPMLPSIQDQFGVKGACVAAVDLIFGLSYYAGLTPIQVEGATGYTDTNYLGKAEAALEALETHDFVFVHIEAPDEASHDGDLEAKIKAIEAIDRDIVGTILSRLKAPTRLLLLPDHATPVQTRTHAIDPVPYCMADFPFAAELALFSKYSEQSARQNGLVIDAGHTLLAKLFAR